MPQEMRVFCGGGDRKRGAASQEKGEWLARLAWPQLKPTANNLRLGRASATFLARRVWVDFHFLRRGRGRWLLAAHTLCCCSKDAVCSATATWLSVERRCDFPSRGLQQSSVAEGRRRGRGVAASAGVVIYFSRRAQRVASQARVGT